MRIGPSALVAVLVALPGSGAWAACPGDAGERLPASGERQALEHSLAALAAECGRIAGYLAYRGALLNALGRHDQAALLLEQALLLDPGLAGAQIDYAEALAAMGDHASATAMLRDVASRPDVPAPLRPRLARMLSALEARQRADASGTRPARADDDVERAGGWQSTGTLAVKLGTDGNLNNAPTSAALTLTLPGGDAVFQLADRFRPRAGAAARLEGAGQWVRPTEGGGALQLYADARFRTSPSASEANYRQLQAGGAWSAPLGPSRAGPDSGSGGAASLGANVSQLRYGGADLYRAERLTASRDWRVRRGRTECRPSVGLEGESRRYPSAADLDGRFLGLSAGVACNAGMDRVVVALRGGVDSARAERPGGKQRQDDLRLVWRRPLAGGRLGADLHWYRQRDADAYSPLLDNGAARRISRTALSLEYSYPIAPGWSVLGALERLEQRSNLGLFDIVGRAFYVGVRWTSGREQ